MKFPRLMWIFLCSNVELLKGNKFELSNKNRSVFSCLNFIDDVNHHYSLERPFNGIRFITSLIIRHLINFQAIPSISSFCSYIFFFFNLVKLPSLWCVWFCSYKQKNLKPNQPIKKNVQIPRKKVYRLRNG